METDKKFILEVFAGCVRYRSLLKVCCTYHVDNIMYEQLTSSNDCYLTI